MRCDQIKAYIQSNCEPEYKFKCLKRNIYSNLFIRNKIDARMKHYIARQVIEIFLHV